MRMFVFALIPRWDVPRGALTYIENLGAGQFGSVDKMVSNFFDENGEYAFVAVKTLLPAGGMAADTDPGDAGPGAAGDVGASADTDVEQKAREADFIREIETMKRLESHPNVVAMLGCCMDTLEHGCVQISSPHLHAMTHALACWLSTSPLLQT